MSRMHSTKVPICFALVCGTIVVVYFQMGWFWLIFTLFWSSWGSKLLSITSELDTSSCNSLLWTPNTSFHSHSTSKGNVSYVLTLISSSQSQLKHLLSQIQTLNHLTYIPITLLVQNNLRELSSLLNKILKYLQKHSISFTISSSLMKLISKNHVPPSLTATAATSAVHILEMSHPLEKNILTKSYVNLLLNSFQYANPNQFFNLNLFLLPFEKVIYINSHLKILKPIDHLFSCPNVDLLYTNAPFHYFDQNIYLIKAGNKELFDDMMTYLLRYSWIEGLHPYQSALQEFFYFYFFQLPQKNFSLNLPPKSVSMNIKRLSSCLYNYQKYPETVCAPEFYQQDLPHHHSSSSNGVSPYAVRSSSQWLDQQLELITSSSSDLPPMSPFKSNLFSSKNKPCVVDFWIIGARKSGTTALYTWLTEHPQVAPLNIRHQSTDGEVMIPLSPGNLLKYNQVFLRSLQSYLTSQESISRGNYSQDSLLIGDSWVGRFLNDDYRTISMCQEKNIKILIILRNPIERCVSQWKMRYRRQIGKLSSAKRRMVESKGELTAMIERGYDINSILEKELTEYLFYSKNNSIHFPSPLQEDSNIHLIPPSLHTWKGSENCIYEGMYSLHLRRWLVAHGVDRIRVYFTDDLERYPADVIDDALQFIGVKDPSLWRYDPIRHTKSSAPNRDLMNLTITLEDSLLRRLKDVFSPSNRELERLLGVESVPWGY